MFLFKAVYMLFWTFILNAICKAGYKEVSWFMVLLPIILLFIIIGIVILNSGSATLFEGFKEGLDHEEEGTNSGATGDDEILEMPEKSASNKAVKKTVATEVPSDSLTVSTKPQRDSINSVKNTVATTKDIFTNDILTGATNSP